MTFELEPEIVLPGLIHIHFNTQYEVTSTFLRLQEFYESSYEEIRNNHFTLEQYMDAYAKDHGNFTYTVDWSGFNVPSNVIEEFAQLFQNDLLDKEKHFLHIILDIVDKEGWDKYYVIASSRDIGSDGGKKDQADVMKHEIAHGLWYLDPDYKKEQMKSVKKVKEFNADIGSVLQKMGYCKEVVDDELQAYCSTSTMTYLADDIFPDQNIPWDLVLDMQRVFEQYYDSLSDSEE